MDIIEMSLRKMGITRCYKGYKQLYYLLNLVLGDEKHIVRSKQALYERTALQFDCKATTIEQNIRTLSSRAWKINPKFLSDMFDAPISEAPSSAQFVAALSAHILKESNLPL